MTNPLPPKPSLTATGSHFFGLGFRAFGGLGAVLALLAGVPAALRDLTAAVAGGLLVTAWTLGKEPLATTTGLVLAGVALAAALARNVNPALLVVAALGHATGTTPRLEFLPAQAGDVEPTHADVRKARDLRGHAPRTPLAAGRQRFSRWLKTDGAAPRA